MNKNQILTLSTAVGILVGVALMGYGAYAILQGMKSQHWPVVTGEILAAKLETIEKRTDYGTNLYYQPEVTYKYQVNGKAYVGDQLRISSPIVFTKSELKEAEDYMAEFKAGNSVTVRFNPDNLGQSTLKSGYNLLLWLFIPAGLFFIGGAMGMYRFTKSSIYW